MKKLKTVIAVIIVIALGGIIMFGFSGCTFGEKHTIDYCGQKDFYKGAKDSYRTGQRVVFTYDAKMIATDTDYSFYLDGERFNPDYNHKKGFIFKFTMPDHDVKFQCVSVNSMIRDYPEEDTMLIDYREATVGTDGYDDSYELVLYSYGGGMAKLCVFKTDSDGEETETTYIVPYDVVSDCNKIINNNDFRNWDKLKDPTCIDGASVVCKFRENDGEYTRVSTDCMPEDGEQKLGEIKTAIQPYLDDIYLSN